MKEDKEMRKLKNKYGITLVALVVTIVVLIILATISINIIFGEEGILEKAKQAKQDYTNAQKAETEEIKNSANEIDNLILGSRTDSSDSNISDLTLEELNRNHTIRNKKIIIRLFNNQNIYLSDYGTS